MGPRTVPGHVLGCWLLTVVLVTGCSVLEPPVEETTGADRAGTATSEEPGPGDRTGAAGQSDGGHSDDDQDGRGPDGSGGSGGSNGSDGSDGGESADADLFSLSLPSGPETVAETVVDDVYIPLQQGECDTAAARLDELEEEFGSHRTVLLYRAAIELCRGQQATARELFAAADALGWSGIGVEYFVVDRAGVSQGTFRYDCEVYRSVRQVLEQVDRGSVSCPGGEPPGDGGTGTTGSEPDRPDPTEPPTTGEPTGTTGQPTTAPAATGDGTTAPAATGDGTTDGSTGTAEPDE